MGAQTGMSRTLQLSALTSAILLSQAAFADRHHEKAGKSTGAYRCYSQW